MCKFESSQKDESRAQSADSSKAYRKPRAFNCSFIALHFQTEKYSVTFLFVFCSSRFFSLNNAKNRCFRSAVMQRNRSGNTHFFESQEMLETK